MEGIIIYLFEGRNTSGPYIVEAMPQEPQSLFANVVNYLKGMVSVSPVYAAGLTTKNYVTDDAGAFAIVLDASAPDPAEVTIKVGDSTQHFVMKKSGVVFCSGGTIDSGTGMCLASGTMNWNAAKSWCSSQGGRLPLIDNRASIDSREYPLTGKSVEGFGAVGGAWPSGFFPIYWAGTAVANDASSSWIISNFGAGVIDALTGPHSNVIRVGCVPQ